jgi:hypothetical protein
MKVKVKRELQADATDYYLKLNGYKEVVYRLPDRVLAKSRFTEKRMLYELKRKYIRELRLDKQNGEQQNAGNTERQDSSS